MDSCVMEAIIEIGRLFGPGAILYALLDKRLTRLETLVELIVRDQIKKGP